MGRPSSLSGCLANSCVTQRAMCLFKMTSFKVDPSTIKSLMWVFTLHATTLMSLEGIMLSEMSQSQRDKNCLRPLIHGT